MSQPGPTQASTRDRLLAAAAQLFQEQGYAATGLNEILDRAGAPKGSLYHYFPEGKGQLASAALARAGARFEATIDALYAETGNAAALAERFAGLLAGWLERSEFKQGCPVATVALEQAAASNEVALTARTVLRSWRRALEAALKTDGIPAERAASLSGFVLSAVEGALILARAEHDGEIVRAAGRESAALIRDALA